MIGPWEAGTIPPPPPPVSSLSIHNHVLSPPNYLPVGAIINTLELWPVLLGIRRFAPGYPDSTIEIVTDNSQVMYMINTGRSSNKFCMSWLRELFWLCFIFNVRIFASYVRSENNTLADSLSRFTEQRKLSLKIDMICSHKMCCSDVISRAYDVSSRGESCELKVKRECSNNYLGKKNPV